MSEHEPVTPEPTAAKDNGSEPSPQELIPAVNSGRDKNKRVLIGRVLSDRMSKTITVLVERRVKHRLYKKYVRRSTKLHVHDEDNGCRIGDLVAIEECRPLSKTKSWQVQRIMEHAESRLKRVRGECQ